MPSYAIMEGVHVTAVLVTLSLFVLRGAWMLAGSAQLNRPWVRIAPHIVDTVLLLSALILAVGKWRWPMTPHDWITGKVLALLIYIVLGAVAIKRGRNKRIRGLAFVAALLVFVYIGHTAISKDPLPTISI